MTFRIGPSLIARLPSMLTAWTRLSAPRSCSSIARATCGTRSIPSAASAIRAPVARLTGRPGFTLGRVAVPSHGGLVLDGAREVLEDDEHEEPADQHEPDALVRRRERLGGRA